MAIGERFLGIKSAHAAWSCHLAHNHIIDAPLLETLLLYISGWTTYNRSVQQIFGQLFGQYSISR